LRPSSVQPGASLASTTWSQIKGPSLRSLRHLLSLHRAAVADRLNKITKSAGHILVQSSFPPSIPSPTRSSVSCQQQEGARAFGFQSNRSASSRVGSMPLTYRKWFAAAAPLIIPLYFCTATSWWAEGPERERGLPQTTLGRWRG
jgi:hypothetical protein